jgi:hypothetical protein
MPDTVAALFRTRAEAEEGLRKLKDAGFTEGQFALSTPRTGRRGRYGLKLLAGLVLGTLIGAAVGAVVTGLVPGVKPLITGNLVATFAFAAVAGAATGIVAGGLISMAASGDTLLFYDQEVQSGRFLVSVAGTGAELTDAAAILLAAGAMEAAPVQAPIDVRRRRDVEGG